MNQAWADYKDEIIKKLTADQVYAEIKNQKKSTDGWITGQCPLHHDKENSFAFNTKTLAFCCFAGCGKGSAFDFIIATNGQSFKDVLLAYGDQLNIPRPNEKESVPPIKESVIKKYCEALTDEPKRWLMDKKGLSEETIIKYEIGWDVKRQRNTIPIRDERGNLKNIRLYNGKNKIKILNYCTNKHRYGSPARLYGVDELIKSKKNTVIICEGEWDRLILQQKGFLAVTGTHGSAVFRPEWVSSFEDKNVVLLYDSDNAGIEGSKNTLKAFKSSKIKSIRNVLLPLKGTKEDKDISDYFITRGNIASDLKKLIKETHAHIYEEIKTEEEIINLKSFVDIEQKKYIDKKIKCEITVCGETSEAFHAVERFKVSFCAKLKSGQCYSCSEDIIIPHGSAEFIGSCMSNDNQITAMLRTFCCNYGQKPSLKILEKATIKEFFCHQYQPRKSNDSAQEVIEKRVYYLSSNHLRPGSYSVIGWVKSSPKTQIITLLIESAEPLSDEYEQFDPALQKNKNFLKKFSELSLEEIVDDLTHNVTRIYERDDLLIAILLTFFSPRWLNFNNERIRGWIVSVITGDAGTGKTQTYQKISEHINVGDSFSALTGSRTGLAYALVEHKQKGWQIKIGRYPANTRKLLFVDEIQFLAPWDMRVLSKAMEEGWLQIDRVQARGYESETRLIMVANPKKDQVMDNFVFGCESLATIFPPAIIRRIDLAVFANFGDIGDSKIINKVNPKTHNAKISSEMLRSVVYWAWKLTPDQIHFDKEAEKICLDKAERLSEKFGYASDVPLVTIADIRNNIARIAAAFAVFFVSSDEQFENLYVKKEHVVFAIKFLNTIYSHENCSLDIYSDIGKKHTKLLDYVDIKKAFNKKLADDKHAVGADQSNFQEIVLILRENKSIRKEDIISQVDCSKDTVKRTIKLLKKYNLITSGKSGYEKLPKFIKFLRKFLKEVPEFQKTPDIDF